MTNTIKREIVIRQPREEVWRAITDSAILAQWMFPSDFEPRVGHRFTFRVPGNPKMNFDGLTVRCEVLECEPPREGVNEVGVENEGGRLVFSWSAGGAVENTRVSFELEGFSGGTYIYFEHSGFDLAHPFGEQAFKGAMSGWGGMFKQLGVVCAEQAAGGK